SFADLLRLVSCSTGVSASTVSQADHLSANGDAAFIQGLDRDLVSLAYLAQHIRLGDSAVVEDQLASGRGAEAELVFLLADLKTGEVPLDQKCSDTAVPGGRIGV